MCSMKHTRASPIGTRSRDLLLISRAAFSGDDFRLLDTLRVTVTPKVATGFRLLQQRTTGPALLLHWAQGEGEERGQRAYQRMGG